MKVELIDMYGFKYTEMKSYMGKSDQLTPSQEAPSNTNEEVINPEITLTNPKG